MDNSSPNWDFVSIGFSDEDVLGLAALQGLTESNDTAMSSSSNESCNLVDVEPGMQQAWSNGIDTFHHPAMALAMGYDCASYTTDNEQAMQDLVAGTDNTILSGGADTSMQMSGLEIGTTKTGLTTCNTLSQDRFNAALDADLFGQADNDEEEDLAQKAFDFRNNADRVEASVPTTPLEETKIYQLRARCQFRFIPIIFIDQDLSGDYDPTAKVSSPKTNTLKRKYRGNGHALEDGADDAAHGPKVKNFPTVLSARQNGKILDVIIPFHPGSVGRAYLSAIKTGMPDRWYPDDNETWNKLNDTCIWDVPSSQCGDNEPSEDEQYLTRSRVAGIKHLSNEEQEFYSHLAGHPVARTCQACYDLHQDCTLLAPGAAWPCQACFDDSCECELLIPPRQKLACERCQRKGQECSYTPPDADHSTACEQCQERGLVCIACPAPTPRIGKDGRPMPSVIRRESSADSSDDMDGTELNGSDVEGSLISAMHAMRKMKQPPESVLTTTLSKRKHSKRAKPASAKETKLSPLTLQLRTITTYFAHPITFGASVSQSTCHFCTIPLHAHFGWGAIHVTIATAPDDASYMEPGGRNATSIPWPADALHGWASRGLEPGRMCLACVAPRIRIVGCPGHTMTVAAQPLGPAEAGAVVDLLNAAKPGEELRGLDARCCAMCVCRASVYQCGAPQPEGGHVGCGLALCCVCAYVLGEGYGGRLEDMIRDFEGGDEAVWPLGLRADRGFLLVNGHMVRQCLDAEG